MPSRIFALLAAAGSLVLALGVMPVRLLSHEKVKTSVTYDREISRILTRRCVACHTAGNLAVPFTTYEETRPWARAIEEEVLARHMPPWRAVSGYGTFANDGSLTTREQQTMLAWIEGNGPKTREQMLIVNIDQGVTAVEEQLKPDFDRWQFGDPHLITPVPAASTPAAGPHGLQVVREVISLGLLGERSVRGLEFRPGDRSGLRAASFSIADTGQWLGSWTPWHPGILLPAGAAYRLGRATRLRVELFYQAGSRPAALAGQLGMSFASETPRECPADVVLRAIGDVAPTTRERFHVTTTIDSDLKLLALAPQFGEAARTLEVRARRPDGRVEILLLVRDVLHDWPTPYIFAAPVTLPRGTELSATSYADNRSASAVPGGIDLRVSAAAPGGCTTALNASN
jgi:hypothetical protein